MIKRVILIDHENYTRRRGELFYIPNLEELGYTVEIWDLSSYLYPNIKFPKQESAAYVRKFYDLSSIDEAFNHTSINNTAFIVEVPDSFQNRAIYRLLSKHQCKTIKMNCYGNSELKKSGTDYLNKILHGRLDRIIMDHFWFNLNKIYKKCHHIEVPDYYLTSNFEQCTHKINHPDFEKARDFNQPPIISGNFIVFIDMFFPKHPDFLIFYKYKKIPDGKDYYQTLNKFFDYLEKKYKMPVIIAAHPQANYECHEFKSRQIIKYHTDNLIHYAQKVILHVSCSLAYMIYDNKPTAFVVTDELLQMKHFIYRTQKITQYCHYPLYNLNHTDYNNIKFSKFSEAIRKNYLYTYLTSKETERKNNIDIVNELLSLI